MMHMIVLQGFRTKQTTPSQPLLYAQQIAISSCDAMNNQQVALVTLEKCQRMAKTYHILKSKFCYHQLRIKLMLFIPWQWRVSLALMDLQYNTPNRDCYGDPFILQMECRL